MRAGSGNPPGKRLCGKKCQPRPQRQRPVLRCLLRAMRMSSLTMSTSRARSIPSRPGISTMHSGKASHRSGTSMAPVPANVAGNRPGPWIFGASRARITTGTRCLRHWSVKAVGTPTYATSHAPTTVGRVAASRRGPVTLKTVPRFVSS